MKRKVKVLVVDGSALARSALVEALASDPEISVVAAVSDPYAAAERLKEEVPDVITLELNLPRMGGIPFLRSLMSQHPLPVVVISTGATPGSEKERRARDCGAVKVLGKPATGVREFFLENGARVCRAVKEAAKIRIETLPRPAKAARPKLSADAVLQKTGARTAPERTGKLLVVGASTGGTDALKEFLTALPADSPPVVIVQHMPHNFTGAFAARLDSLCRIAVKEAEDGDSLQTGLALIAPGDRHMLLCRSGRNYKVEVRDGPPVCRHRPSVDVLFRSAANCAGPNAIGLLMTGMGDDGAAGMVEMKHAGALTIAQDEASCAVFGMPKEAIRRGGVALVLPLSGMAAAALKASRQGG